MISNVLHSLLNFQIYSFNSFTFYEILFRGGSRAAATSKMELFVIIVNGFQPLTIITKWSILDVAAILDPTLLLSVYRDSIELSCVKEGLNFVLCLSEDFLNVLGRQPSKKGSDYLYYI